MIIEIENIFKSYNNAPAVRGVSLKIARGERTVILGPSGCGKTTLLRIIAGFIQPDRGRVVIDGSVAAENGGCLVAPEHRKIGMVFQDLALWPHMSVYGNLEFGLKARKIPKKERRERMDAMLDKVQLARFKNSFPNDLSGGQQQRVALARALVMEPRILLMDEPLSNLDPDLNLLLRREILRLQEDLGITLMYVTHDREEASFLATKIVVMEHGQIRRTDEDGEHAS